RGARVADPAPATRRADPARAAAAEGSEPAPGGPQVRVVPGHARDVPGMPPGRVRPGRAEAAAPGPPDSADRPRRRRVGLGLALFRLAPLRLHRDVHVRGRHASRRAAGAGAVARPRPPPGAARAGRAPGPARPG